jgi:heme/copper-type cytochrome/quinol oxidase subunit 2
LLSATWNIFRIILIPLATIIGLIVILVSIWFVVFLLKGNRLQKGEHNKVNRDKLLKNLFYNFPVRYCKDLFARDPEFFRNQGCIVFTGRQGYGKTIGMVEQCMMWQKEYPKAKVITNLAYKRENDALRKWQQLVDYKKWDSRRDRLHG